ncbi:Rossmann-like and DUF2520 domain-containing protein [Noviherbaspirillum autotrophicum]|uniref:Oxidoreductase domain-containing protein n=1 Tax=Noviherbaspirillum autotrophicum TaxID=709839 RepID=A0A0C1Y6L7_9BURK|nr:Rossmann-like and DUF2520 domain-containing protein [Noviherbaspirillum autotrophicum]KIF82603.1 oxidoreductase domain-containing protein [Noviherbaspirillum autotrophicum]
MAATLNIVGCGKLGRTLARLWTDHSVLTVQDVLNQSLESAQQAVSFVGAGQAVADYASLRPADIYMIAATDDRIVPCCEELARAGKLTAHTVVFHCSGALPSGALQAAQQAGAAVASVHPIRSFASPQQAAADFAGTYCGVEGDPQALATLNESFAAIGARMVPIHADCKVIYHAAAVFASNYLVTLLDVALQAYAKSGVPQDVALRMMEPLVRGTLDNVFNVGTVNALTGPIARGDMATADRQARAVAEWNKNHGKLYEQFVELTKALAARRHSTQT